MTFVSYSRYSRNPEATPAANWQKAILDPVYEFEQSCAIDDDFWEGDDGGDPYEFFEKIQAGKDVPDYLVSLVETRLRALNQAGNYVSFSEAAAILRMSEDELHEDIEARHIPIFGDDTLSTKLLRFLLMNKIGL